MSTQVQLSPHALLTLTLVLPSLIACDQVEQESDSLALTVDLQAPPPARPIIVDVGRIDRSRSARERGTTDPDRAPRDLRLLQPGIDHALDRSRPHDRGDLGARPLDSGAGAADAEATRDAAPPHVDCTEALEPPLSAGSLEAASLITGTFEFAQSHVVRADEQRHAPRLAQARELLLLFTPDEPLEPETQGQLQIIEGEILLGVLPLTRPGEGPAPLEAALSTAELEGYGAAAYSAHLPWFWVREGVELRLFFSSGERRQKSPPHQLSDLAPPHRFTLTRTRMVLFGEEDFEVSNTALEQLGRDFMPTLPFAELRLVESHPWRLNEVVVATPEGARLVRSEAERRVILPERDHWSILKNQAALRLSLANTGRGLRLTQPAEGDSSPLSWGTSVTCGWFRDPEGRYLDIDDAPWAAGWTGWTALWLNQCGNVFIHEVGHSFTLAHFTEGSAAQWGIGEEYPLDGTHLASHPWGYDTLRRQLRTWYRVDTAGPARDDAGALIGKRDPMNGGERANAESCFPQYTAYHGEKIQRWAEENPVLLSAEEAAEAGLELPAGQAATFARWDRDLGHYQAITLDDPVSPPVAARVPVATLIGTLGRAPETKQVYPPIFSGEGNVFALPDPRAELPAPYQGSVYFLSVDYAEGAREYGLIQEPPVEDTRLALYALNLDLRRRPTTVRLYESPRPYPELDIEGAALLDEREILIPERALPKTLRYGQGRSGGGPLKLRGWCDEGYNCTRRSAEEGLRLGSAPISFTHSDEAESGRCLSGNSTRILIEVNDTEGNAHPLSVRAARVITSARCAHQSPPNDASPWCASAAQTQALRLWIPFDENRALSPGRYRGRGTFEGWRHELNNAEVDEAQAPLIASLGDFPFEVDLEIQAFQQIDLSEAAWRAPPVSAEDSSVYYLLRDSAIGPTNRVWWDDPAADPVRLRLPVRRIADGAHATLIVDARHFECGETPIDLHAGRGANDCAHELVLSIDPAQNPALAPGARYESLPSSPLLIDARRWHAPDAERILESYRLQISYRHPE